eukprot:137858-Chlamydomonas_euryale.AAC.2
MCAKATHMKGWAPQTTGPWPASEKIVWGTQERCGTATSVVDCEQQSAVPQAPPAKKGSATGLACTGIEAWQCPGMEAWRCPDVEA